MNKVNNREDKPHIEKNMFFHRGIWIRTTEVSAVLSARPGRNTRTEKHSVFRRNWGHKTQVLFSHKHPEISSHSMILKSCLKTHDADL